MEHSHCITICEEWRMFAFALVVVVVVDGCCGSDDSVCALNYLRFT